MSSKEKNPFTSAEVTMFDVREDTNPRRENKHSSAASLSFGNMNSNIIGNEENLVTAAEVVKFDAGETPTEEEKTSPPLQYPNQLAL